MYIALNIKSQEIGDDGISLPYVECINMKRHVNSAIHTDIVISAVQYRIQPFSKTVGRMLEMFVSISQNRFSRIRKFTLRYHLLEIRIHF